MKWIQRFIAVSALCGIAACVASGSMAANTKSQDIFASGDRGIDERFSAGPCRDPQIAVRERQEGARAYLDTDGKVKIAADYLARRYGDPFVNSGAVCAGHPGIVFLIPDRFDAEFKKIVGLVEQYGSETPQPDAVPSRQRTPTRLSSIASNGCPYPPDIDPNALRARAPAEIRDSGIDFVRDAEAAFQHRLTLCQQQRGYLVPGGCASVCFGEDRFDASDKTRIPPTAAKQQEDTCRDPPTPESRFKVGDINQADPALLVTAKIMEGWDDCAKARLGASIALLPLKFVIDKYRGLQTLVSAFGYAASIPTLIGDIEALRQPGQSLGDAAYHVGRLLCDGQDLRSILGKAVNRNTVAHFHPRQRISPTATKPLPALRTIQPAPAALPHGFTPLDDRLLRNFARDNKIILILRNSNVAAARWINYPGAVAKPMALKAKSLAPPPDNSRLSLAARADEAHYAPYYGLASARGLSQAERDAVLKAGFLIQAKCNGEVITTRQGGFIYSDIDVHGIYDLKGNWAGSNAALKALNGMTTQRYFQHRAQDDFVQRNDPRGASFGPQPPVTAYTPNGPVQLNTMAEMKAFYEANQIDWHALYPKPLSHYQAISGKP